MKLPSILVVFFSPWLFFMPIVPSLTAAQELLPTVAVLELKPKGVTELDASVLTDRLRSELGATRAFDLMERQRMEDILAEQGLGLSGCTDRDCAVQYGQLLQVQKMVAGIIGKVGETFTVSARMFDVETGRIEAQAIEDCPCKIDEVLTRTMQAVALELAGQPVEPVQPQQPAGKPTPEPTGQERFQKARAQRSESGAIPIIPEVGLAAVTYVHRRVRVNDGPGEDDDRGGSRFEGTYFPMPRFGIRYEYSALEQQGNSDVLIGILARPSPRLLAGISQVRTAGDGDGFEMTLLALPFSDRVALRVEFRRTSRSIGNDTDEVVKRFEVGPVFRIAGRVFVEPEFVVFGEDIQGPSQFQPEDGVGFASRVTLYFTERFGVSAYYRRMQINGLDGWYEYTRERIRVGVEARF